MGQYGSDSNTVQGFNRKSQRLLRISDVAGRRLSRDCGPAKRSRRMVRSSVFSASGSPRYPSSSGLEQHSDRPESRSGSAAGEMMASRFVRTLPSLTTVVAVLFFGGRTIAERAIGQNQSELRGVVSVQA